jgi:WD40 repeat protein
MSYCVNAECPQPENPPGNKFCQNCGTKLLLGDRYRARSPLSKGGISQTFIGVDEQKATSDPCVIKQFRPYSQAAQASFLREVLQLETISQHPQLPTLLNSFQQSDRQYLILEYIQGETLAQESQHQGNFSETKIEQILAEILPILHFLHQNKFIHRDIKPENIIRRPDNTLALVDFGLVKRVTGTTQKAGTTVGSAEYTAPEQLMGQASFSSDIYSLGVTCISLLTQMPPFDLFDMVSNTWVWQDFLLTPISDTLRQVLDRAILSADRRYQSVEPMWQALFSDRALPTFDIEATPAPASPVPASSPSPAPTPDWQCVLTLTSDDPPKEITDIALIPPSQILASADWDGTVKLWDLHSGQLLHTLTDPSSGVVSLTATTDGNLLAAGSADGTIWLWNLRQLRQGETPTLLHTLREHSSVVASVAIQGGPNPGEGQLLASASRDRTVKLWHLPAGQLHKTLSGHQERVTCIAFSPNHSFLVSGSQDTKIKIWQLPNGEPVGELSGHQGVVHAVAVTADGKAISSSWDRTIKIWQLSTGACLHSFSGHLLPAVSISSRPHSKLFATGSHDGTIKLWTTDTAKCIATLAEHTQGVAAVKFSPDGSTLASCSADGTVKLWRAAGERA